MVQCTWSHKRFSSSATLPYIVYTIDIYGARLSYGGETPLACLFSQILSEDKSFHDIVPDIIAKAQETFDFQCFLRLFSYSFSIIFSRESFRWNTMSLWCLRLLRSQSLCSRHDFHSTRLEFVSIVLRGN